MGSSFALDWHHPLNCYELAAQAYHNRYFLGCQSSTKLMMPRLLISTYSMCCWPQATVQLKTSVSGFIKFTHIQQENGMPPPPPPPHPPSSPSIFFSCSEVQPTSFSSFCHPWYPGNLCLHGALLPPLALRVLHCWGCIGNCLS